MATEAGFETLPGDGPKQCPGGLYGFMRSCGATIAKMRSDGACDPGKRAVDYDQVCNAICNGLKILTRPDWSEGVPLTDYCAAEAPIHRFFDVIAQCVGPGNHKPHWFGHIVANEPDETPYYQNAGVPVFKDHLKQFAQKVVNNSWQWIGMITPPCVAPVVYADAGPWYRSIVDAFREAPDTMTNAFSYLGFHIYWENDSQRENLIWKAIEHFAKPVWSVTQPRGKYLPLVIDEFSVSPGFLQSCYDPNLGVCLRHGSMRHFVYQWACGAYPTDGHRAAAITKFIMTADANWNRYVEGQCGRCDGQAGEPSPGRQATYNWILEPRGWCP